MRTFKKKGFHSEENSNGVLPNNFYNHKSVF